jgi:signal transduction histidine kinase
VTLRPVRPYVIVVLGVAGATALALACDLLGIDRAERPLFILMVGGTFWYLGNGPGVFALALLLPSFAFFFTEPRYTFTVSGADIGYMSVFVLAALMIGWFAGKQREVQHDLRTARAALEKRTAELEAANKELEAFAYSTSHDLRAPLRHMTGFSELLQKHAAAGLDEKSRRYIAMMLESAKRMGTLIDDLLDFSRIGRAEAHNTLVSLDELVSDVRRDVERDAAGRDIEWKVGALPSLHGDRAMLRVALSNLIANAVKFTRTRPRAEIEIGSTNGKPGEVVVFVKDNGVGFDMRYVGKLFGVFQRLHRSDAFEGTGIGLATVQRILARHGGRVWAEGAVDGGATFYIAAPKP